MEFRKLGRFEVSEVGLGCNNFGRVCDEKQSAVVVSAALGAGINFFDTADVYGSGLSEEYLGKALGSGRDDVAIASKFGHQMGDDPTHRGGSPRWISQAVEGSLKRLGTDRIDVYQMHVPDPEVPIEETLGALGALVEAGKVLEIGCSNYDGSQIDAATTASITANLLSFVSAQNHYSLLHRQPESNGVTEACERLGLGLLPYFPLASGLLTGKYRRGEELPADTRLGRIPAERASRFLNDENFTKVEQLEKLAAGAGRSLLELAIGWLLSQPSVASVIAGATKPEQVQANAASGTWRLSEDELSAVDAITSL